jgi:excisionase family DNA binding protein
MLIEIQNDFLPYTFNQKQAAAYVNLAVSTFRKYLAAGKIPQPMRLGGRIVRFSRRSLDEWLQKQGCHHDHY